MADNEVVTVEMGVDMSTAERAMSTFRSVYAKQIGLIKKATDKSTAGMVRGFKAYFRQQSDTIKAQTTALGVQKKATAEVERLTRAIEDQRASLDHLIKAKAQSITLTEKENAELEDGLAAIQRRTTEMKEYAKVAEEASKAAKEAKTLAGAKIEFLTEDVQKVFKEGGEAIADSFRSVLQKDAPEAFKGFGKLLAMGLKGTGGLGNKLSGAGSKLWGKGSEMASKGGAMNKVGGISLGVLGGIAKAIGPVLQLVSKLEPLVSMLSSVGMSLVKLFIDSEAVVKDIHKELLATGGAGEFLYTTFDGVHANVQKADGAAADLGGTLKNITDSALNLNQSIKGISDVGKLANMQWGIQKETHTQVIGALEAEGVSLKALNNQYADLNKRTAAFSDDFGSVTQLAVTYSRLMGVSLQDVTSLQAEMMTEMGASFADTQMALHQMTMGAVESGIATNKFFGIIRSVSADLSLYNTRMGDAAKMLTNLGKVMSAKSAQKFMSTAMNAVKGMGRIQRLQTTLLAGGGETAEIVKRDIEDTQEAVAKSLANAGGLNVDVVQKALASGNEEQIAPLMDAVKKRAPHMVGELNEALTKLSIKKAMAGKGDYGVGQAAGETGPAAQLQIMQKALAKWGGGKTLMEGVGSIGMEQMAENLGVQRDQLDHMIMFEKSIDMQRKILKTKLSDPKVQEKLTKAGIKIGKTEAETTDAINKAGYDQIFKALDEGDQEALKKMTEEADYAKKMADNTQTTLDKLSTLVDWLMGQFYNVFLGIYDAILSLPMLGGEAKEKRKDLKFIQSLKDQKDPVIQAALKAAAGADPGHAEWAFRDAIANDPKTAALLKYLHTVKTDAGEEAQRQVAVGTAINSLGEAQLKNSYAQMKGARNWEDLAPNLKKGFEESLAKSGLMEAYDEQVTSTGQNSLDATKHATRFGAKSGGVAGAVDAAATVARDTKTVKKYRMKSGVDAYKAMRDAGMSEDMIAEVAGKAMSGWSADLGTGQVGAGAIKGAEIRKLVSSSMGGSAPSTVDTGAMAPYSVEGAGFTSTTPGSATGTAVGAGGAPATATSAPATASAGTSAPATKADAKATTGAIEAHTDATKETTSAVEGLQQFEKQKNAMINPSVFKSKYQTEIENGTLDALRTALWEFALLTQFDKVAKWKDTFGGNVSDAKSAFAAVNKYYADRPAELGLKANAAGGVVTDIGADGVATIRPAPGEGLTSIGKGERIVPAGGGAQTIVLELRGDLGRLIEAKAQDTIVKHTAASRFR